MSDDKHNKGDDNGKLLYCSFCGKSQHEVRKLIAGPSVFVCDECVELCNDIIREEVEDKAAGLGSSKLPTPHEINQRLDDYVIGQAAAGQPLEPGAHVIGQAGRPAHVEAQLDRRRYLVDVLPPRPRGAHETFAQFVVGDGIFSFIVSIMVNPHRRLPRT